MEMPKRISNHKELAWLDPDYKRKLKAEAAIKGFPTMIEYTRWLVKQDKDLTKNEYKKPSFRL